MAKAQRRQFGNRVDFKSMGCAPINEQGVVYLFGVLHDALDLKVESVQTGFPDCVVRRPIGKDRWEELRVEFEFPSRNFKAHKHDPFGADMIVCWEHDWPDCPEHLEIIELRKLIHDVEDIATDVKTPETLTEYQRFCREKRLEGLPFSEIAKLWRAHRNQEPVATDKHGKTLSPWQEFCREKRLEGQEFSEIVRLWKERKAGA